MVSERATGLAVEFTTDPRIEAGKLKASAVDRNEGAELSVGIGRIGLWCAGCVEFGRALALAMAAFPNEVGSATLASIDFVLVLSEFDMGHDQESNVLCGAVPRTKRLSDTIFGWGSLQLVHFTYREMACKGGVGSKKEWPPLTPKKYS